MDNRVKPEWNFGSDNIAPVAEEILASMAAANTGNAAAYGADALSLRMEQKFADIFERREVAVFALATGTAANALALSALVPPYGAVLCAADSHINTDECGAPEFFCAGAKMLALPAAQGRLHPGQLAAPVAQARAMGVHAARPAALSLTQATECGTAYTPAEIAALAQTARSLGLRVQMDGARFANALVAQNVTPAEMSWKAGVDVLCFGATKNGAMAAEAVVFFDTALAEEFGHRRKRGGQLWSKHRFLAAQFLGYFEDDLWLRHARHANAMAAGLARVLAEAGARLKYPVMANEVFAVLPEALAARLEALGFGFYRWGVEADGVLLRLVTSFATSPAAVEAMAEALR